MNKQFTLRATMMLAVISTIIGIGVTPILLQQQSANGLVHTGDLQKGVVNHEEQRTKAPIATSGDNVYIAWWTNKTGNNEVMFRASNDNGATFGHKTNLSNTTEADSEDAEIAASGDNVYVTWWERNETSEEPVLRVSSDNGGSFGPILKLASNGTIGGGG